MDAQMHSMNSMRNGQWMDGTVGIVRAVGIQ